MKKYYSQCGQDKWVIEQIFDYEENGFFLDLGAGNGIYVSNTYALEKHYGWKGICIEANDELFNELKKNRKCFCDHSCVDGRKHNIKFVNSCLGRRSNPWYYYRSGIVDEDTDNKYAADFIVKETTTLLDILKKYNAPKIINYFSFDVEGAETRILKDFLFDRYIFLSISIERPSKLLNSILKKNMYVVVGSDSLDILYIHKSLFKDISLKSLINKSLFEDVALKSLINIRDDYEVKRNN